MKPGQLQTLTIAEQISSGFILKDEDGEKAFIQKIFADESWEVGSEVEVFVYQDDGALKATTEKANAEEGQFAVMTCVQSLPTGAFMDWGIIKDLFVPYKQQKSKILEAKRYLVYVYTDDVTGLTTGTTKFKRNPQYEDVLFQTGEKENRFMRIN